MPLPRSRRRFTWRPTKIGKTLDPAFASGVQTGAIVAKLYDGLMRYDYESTEVVPNLAENVEVNDDATVFTITLRDGVTFHDGSPLTAEDVKYSFERVLNPDTASPVSWVFEDAGISGIEAFVNGEADGVSGIEVLDPQTVRITLEQPYAPFLFHLAMPAAHIVSEAITSTLAEGSDLSSNPVGTGPFTLADRVRDSSLTLSAYEDYFAGAPAVDEVEYRIITDPLITWQEFSAGNLDVAAVPDALFGDITTDPQFEDMLQTLPELAVYYFALNQSFEPFQDLRVRRAVAMAIDRQAIIDGIFNGKDLLANSPIPPGLAGYDAELQAYSYDPEMARQLLDEAGYGDGFDLTIWSTRTPTTIACERGHPILLERNRHPRRTQPGRLRHAARRGPSTGAPPPFTSPGSPTTATRTTSSTRLYVASGADRYGYSNPEVAEIVGEAATKGELSERVPLYQEAQRLVVEDVPVVYIRYPVSYYAVRPGVTGILNHPIFNADKFMEVTISN